MNWKLIAAVIAGGLAVLKRSGNQDEDTSEADELRAEVARLRGDTSDEGSLS